MGALRPKLFLLVSRYLCCVLSPGMPAHRGAAAPRLARRDYSTIRANTSCALILGGAALFFLLLAFFVLGAIVALFAKDFCVPIMAMENVGVLDAWRRLLPMLAAEKMAFTGYVLMKIVLAIGSAIIFGIITLLTLIILLIPLGIAGVIIFFGGKAMGLTFNVATISILVVMGGVILAGFIYLIALINTPPMVFFQSYVLHFIGSRYPALGAVVFPPPPETPPPPALDAPPILEPPPEPAPAG